MKKTLLLLLFTIVLVGCKKDEGGNEDLGMNSPELYLQLMESSQLAINSQEYASSPDLVWTSRNPEVATVSKTGQVTAIAPGVTEVYAFVSGKNSVRSVCKVTVSGEVKAKLLIEQVGGDITVGDTITANLTYSATLADNLKPVSVITSDSIGMKIAQVSANVKTGKLQVIALQPGTVRVKLVNKIDARVKDSIDFVVKPSAITTFKFKNTVNDVYELNAGGTGKLELEIAPASANYRSIYWKSSNPKIVAVDQTGAISAVAVSGTAKISASTPNGNVAVCDVVINSVGGDLAFANKTITVSSINTPTQEIALGLITSPALATVSVRVDNSYTPKQGLTAKLTLKNNTTAVFNYVSSQIGTDRIIAESTKDGKVIRDTCYVVISDVSDALVKCKSVFTGVELGKKTLFTAKIANFTATQVVLKKLELIEIKYSTVSGKVTENWVVVEAKDNLSIGINPVSPVTVDFAQVGFTPVTVVTPRENFRVRYTYAVGSATNVVVREVTTDDGAAFAPAK